MIPTEGIVKEDEKNLSEELSEKDEQQEVLEEKEPSLECDDEKKEEAEIGKKTAELEETIKTLEEEISNLKNELLLKAADTENYRKRLLKDKENAVKYANESLLKDLLDPIDNFSRAIEAASKSSDFEALRSGVAMTENQILSLLKNNWGLERMSSEGQPFDPQTMEAYQAEEVEGLEKETVLQVYQEGYILNGKVIRTSKVKVGKPKA